MRFRRYLYKRGLITSFHPAIPCISIGNISWGGSGKTPLTAWLLEWAHQNGIRTSVLSRGYGGKAKGKPIHVKSGTSPQTAGDEPVLLAKAFPEAFIVVAPKRAEAARFALQYFNPQLMILDDGMQHLAINRHLNLTLFRPIDLEGQWNCVLPTGSWRESAKALYSADAFFLKASALSATSLTKLIGKRLEKYQKPIFSFDLKNTSLQAVNLAAHINPSPLAKPGGYIFFCGLGSPQHALNSLKPLLSVPPVKQFIFPDHYCFQPHDIKKMAAFNLPLVCTPKDAVKLNKLLPYFGTTPVWVVQPELSFGPYWFSSIPFPAWWLEQWQKLEASLSG